LIIESNYSRGVAIKFPDWPQCISGVLSQPNSCT